MLGLAFWRYFCWPASQEILPIPFCFRRAYSRWYHRYFCRHSGYGSFHSLRHLYEDYFKLQDASRRCNNRLPLKVGYLPPMTPKQWRFSCSLPGWSNSCSIEQKTTCTISSRMIKPYRNGWSGGRGVERASHLPQRHAGNQLHSLVELLDSAEIIPRVDDRHQAAGIAQGEGYLRKSKAGSHHQADIPAVDGFIRNFKSTPEAAGASFQAENPTGSGDVFISQGKPQITEHEIGIKLGLVNNWLRPPRRCIPILCATAPGGNRYT